MLAPHYGLADYEAGAQISSFAKANTGMLISFSTGESHSRSKSASGAEELEYITAGGALINMDPANTQS